MRNRKEYIYLVYALIIVTAFSISRISQIRDEKLLNDFINDEIVDIKINEPSRMILIDDKIVKGKLLEIVNRIETIESKAAGSFTEITLDLHLIGEQFSYDIIVFKNRSNKNIYIYLNKGTVSLTYKSFDELNFIDTFYDEYVKMYDSP